MSRQVLITTPIPTLDEVVKELGISKARRDSIIEIVKAGITAKAKRVSAPASSQPSFRKKAKSRTATAKNGSKKKIG